MYRLSKVGDSRVKVMFDLIVRPTGHALAKHINQVDCEVLAKVAHHHEVLCTASTKAVNHNKLWQAFSLRCDLDLVNVVLRVAFMLEDGHVSHLNIDVRVKAH